MKIHTIYILLIAMACAMLPASCASDNGDSPDGGYGRPVDISVNISVPAPTATLTPDGFRPQAPETDNELIHNWKVVFIDNSGTVRAIFDGGDINGVGKHADTFKGELPTGTYKVYAFANIPPAAFTSHTATTFTVGSAVANSDGLALDNAIFHGLENSKDPNLLVPMTGTRTVTVTGRTEEPFAIEVTRLLAKVEFTFSNLTDRSVTINSVSFGPKYTGDAKMFHNPAGRPEIPATATLTTAPVLDGNALRASTMAPGVGYDEGAHGWLYLHESVPDSHPTGRYLVNVELTRADGTTDVVTALTQADVIPYINRNDYIQIPIAISDWLVDFDVLFYPPIGGYPAVLKESQGKDFYFKFGTQGTFNLIPRIRRAQADSPYLQPSQYEITVSAAPPTSTFFTKVPAPDSNGEIIGELSGEEGTAAINVSVHIKGTATDLIYTRTIYIIRQ